MKKIIKRSNHTTTVSILCPIHDISKCYSLYDKYNEVFGVGCEKCYEDVKVLQLELEN